jgi:phage gpG-like protein
MKFEVLVFGEKKIATQFTRMGDDIINASPAFEDVADYLMKTTETTFNSEGRRGGGSWKALTAKWFTRKLRKGWDPRILHKFGDLRESVTRRGATGQILEITDTSLLFGSKLDYAARHQFGHRQTPERPFVKVTTVDSVKIRDMIRDHLMRAWRAR